jgi:acyl-homoserine-lactone acylase
VPIARRIADRERELKSHLIVAAACCTAALFAGAHAEPVLSRDALGTVQIRASSAHDLGIGYGRVIAVDGLCASATEFASAAGERTRYLGESEDNVRSDLLRKALLPEMIERLQASRGGPSPDARELVRGVVRGYNAALVSEAGHPAQDPACAGTALAHRPVTERDVWAVNQSGPYNLLFDWSEAILEAAPPDRAGTTARNDEFASGFARPGLGTHRQPGSRRPASLALALGGDVTANGRGLLYGSPHSESTSARHFLRLTLHGEFDAFASVAYYPGLTLETFAKDGVHAALTAHNGTTFAIVELALDPGDPLVYRVDGRAHRIEPREVTIETRAGGPSVSHTFWRSEHGFIIEGELFPWSAERAYALIWTQADSGATAPDNLLGLLRAKSLRDVVAAHQHFPPADITNFCAVDAAGNAAAAPAGHFINVPREQLERCRGGASLGHELAQYGIPLLDGSRDECRVRTAAGNPARFGMPLADIPAPISRHAILDVNSAPWRWDAARPVRGYSPFIDGYVHPQDGRLPAHGLPLDPFRQRAAPLFVADRLAGIDGRPGNRFNLPILVERIFDSDDFSARWLKAQVLAFCDDEPIVHHAGRLIGLADACSVLARWDGRTRPESRGAVLWRSFFGLLPRAGEYAIPAGIDFDANPDPFGLPGGFRPEARETVLQALARTLVRFEEQGLPIDVPVSEAIRLKRGQEFPTSGCTFQQGCLNLIALCEGVESWCGLPIRNVVESWDGALVSLFAGFDDDGRPIAAYATTNSASLNPRSTYHATGLALWALGRTQAVDFTKPFARTF